MKFTKFGKALLMSALSAGVVLGFTSCVQSYTVGFLYVTGTSTAQTSGNGIISGFKIDHNTGRLSAIHGLPISSGGANPGRFVLLSGGRFLYVLNQGANADGGAVCTSPGTSPGPCSGSNITQFAVGGNGILTAQETFYTQGINPFRIIGDSSGNYIYVLDHDAPSDSHCFDINGNAASACADITTFKVDATTGRLSLVVNAQITAANGSALPYFPVPSNPIDFVLANGNILTLSGTPTTGDSVFPYTYNSTNGQLTINQNTSQVLTNAENSVGGTTGFTNGLVDNAKAIDFAGGVVYVLDNEPITVTVNGTTTTSPSQFLPYTIGSNGALQSETSGAIPDDASQSNPVSLIVEAQKGTWLYAANQGNNSDVNNAQSGLSAYYITSPYALTPIPNQTGTAGTGAGPQCIVEDPSYQFVYTANFNDLSVTGRAIDHNSGALNNLNGTANKSYPLDGPAAWCVVSGRTS